MNNAKIISAVYGTKDNAYVVTCRVQQMADQGKVRMDVNNENFGDPDVGHTKHFAATYVIDGHQRAVACVEGQSVDIE